MRVERHRGARPRNDKEQRVPAELCTECGLCCDGTIFGDLRLSAEDRKRLSGTPYASRALKLRQPCPAFIKGLCAVYYLRPGHCQAFECLLFQRVRAGEVSIIRAKRTVRSAKRLTARVRRLLRGLGETNEELALSERFRSVSRRLEAQGADSDEASLFSELTLAMQKLQTLLACEFYPGDFLLA